MNISQHKFKAGDLLQSSIHPNYHVFVDEVLTSQYKVCHVFIYENDKLIQYSKNAGHDCWMKFEEIEIGTLSGYGSFKKVGYIPALISNKTIRINKVNGEIKQL